MTIYDEEELEYEGTWTYEDLTTLATTGSACGNGWVFFIRNPAGRLIQVNPTIDGEMSFDSNREIRRSISGQILLPSENEKFPFGASGTELYAFLVLAGDVFPMGIFLLTELVVQPDSILDPRTNLPSYLIHVSWGDRMLRLRANDGSGQTIPAGADPSQEMDALLTAAGLPHSLAGSASLTSADLTWDGNATLGDKIEELGELAGHRPAWPDNNGTIRSEEGAVDPSTVIPLLDLMPVAGSINVTLNFLSAPNRVIVTDNSGGPYPVRGQWDAPASAPHSYQNRGWVQTEMVSLQGLTTSSHAEQVARTIGESYTGRTLNCQLAVPTYKLDGPVFLSYDGATWILKSWSCSLGPNEPMTLTAEEYLLEQVTADVGRAVV